MIDILFDKIIELSISASFLAMIIIIVKSIFKEKFNPRWHYMIWIILIIKLLIPVSIDYNLNSNLNYNLDDSVKSKVLSLYKVSQYNIESYSPPYIDAIEGDLKEFDYRINVEWTMYVFKLLWLIIVLINIAIRIYSECKFYIEHKSLVELSNPKFDSEIEILKSKIGLKKNIPILISKGDTTPKVYGFVCPKIIISEEVLYTYDELSISHILLHELCHIKRRDVFLNVINKTLMCIHFFNPIIVWSLKRMTIDCESACDEMVLEHINIEEHKSYAYTLINLISSSRFKQNTLNLAFCKKKDIVRRLEMINKYKKISLSRKLSSALVAGVIISLALISPLAVAEDEVTIDADMKATVEKTIDLEEKTELSFIRPLESGTITSYYGSHFNDSKFHEGVDIGAKDGSDIVASESGKVVYIDLNESRYGKMLVIEHKDNIKTLYAQCSEILVNVDDIIKKGDLIAKVGSSGKSTGPHLHFGLLKDDKAIDPKLMMDWIK